MQEQVRRIPQDEYAAELHGRDAHKQGVGILGARVYSDNPRIQDAWRRGWQDEDDARSPKPFGYN